MSEKPLHVRVAEALGWSIKGSVNETWWGVSPDLSGSYSIPHFDTDWSATGPLIERFRIMVQPASILWMASMDRPDWECPFGAEGKTPLGAVCNLIVALSAAGKLAPSLSSASPSP